MTYSGASVLTMNAQYFGQLIRSQDRDLATLGAIDQIRGYTGYNQLIRINSIFSSAPRGTPTDRTGRTVTPLKIYPGRPWQYNSHPIDLGTAFANRVLELESTGQRINAMWSGGIDSTTMVNALVVNLAHRDQLRVLYSPFSVYEHAPYLGFLIDLGVETVDISGQVYLDQFFDGLFVTGDAGDESYASLDESFIEAHGFSVLSRPWSDFFWQQTQDQEFMDFCADYFASCGRPINTVLEARWWFYINSKYRCMLNEKLPFWVDYPGFNSDLVRSFFDCDWFDQYITHQTHNIIKDNDYQSWKQDLKDYCLSIDGFGDWDQVKTKVNSNQLAIYSRKKCAMKNLWSLYILMDGRRISTANMPLFSVKEFQAKYGHSLDCLWNEPDPV